MPEQRWARFAAFTADRQLINRGDEDRGACWPSGTSGRSLCSKPGYSALEVLLATLLEHRAGGSGLVASTIMAMLDHPEFARWLESSDDELRVATELTRLDAFNSAVLHYEQAGQVALKGLLRGVGLGEHAWGHSLTELASRASAHAGLDIPEDVAQAIAVLERDYMPTRYPDALVSGTPLGNYSSADAERARTTSERIRSLIVETWERLLAEEGTEQE